MTSPLSVVVLAAGKGTRMNSPRPKVLHELAGWPLLHHVLHAADALEPCEIVLVLAPDMDEVAASARSLRPDISVALQDPPLGTGHAVQAAMPALKARGTLLVLYGDTPLISPATLQALLTAQARHAAAVAVLGFMPPERKGYGRLRIEDGELVEIVEAKHADAELLANGVCNSGVMAIDGAIAQDLLDAIPVHADKNEYYLTEIVRLARARERRCVAVEGPWQDGIGVNSQDQLADCAALLQQRLRARAMQAGVTLIDPASVYLAADTVIGAGTVIEPQVVIGPGVRIGARARINAFCHLTACRLDDQVEIGPFARLRGAAQVEAKARIGNFVELKNTTMGQGAKANHLTYLGDATIGAGANIGAGTITCNYDGSNKWPTEIGADAFIGSNTSLVAPITVGAGAYIGAGSVIAKRPVAANGLAVTRAERKDHTDGAARLRARAQAAKQRVPSG